MIEIFIGCFFALQYRLAIPISREEEHDKILEMPLRYILDKHDQQFTYDINGYIESDTAVMAGEQPPVDNRHEGRDIKEEVKKAPLQNKLEKTYFHAETVIVVSGKILVIRLQPKEVRTEIGRE